MAALKILECQNRRSGDENDLNAIAQNNEKLRQWEAQSLSTFSPPEIMISRIDAILAFDRTAELSRITTPALIVGAQDDVITPHYFAEGCGMPATGNKGDKPFDNDCVCRVAQTLSVQRLRWDTRDDHPH